MVESIYFLKPAWCGTHFAGLWPEQGFQPATRATALRRWFVTARIWEDPATTGLSGSRLTHREAFTLRDGRLRRIFPWRARCRFVWAERAMLLWQSSTRPATRWSIVRT